MVNNTFLGLQPYTEDDAYRFKGRTEESQELFRLIVRNDYTMCYAESGEGKTSLLNAGVFPLLREKMYFPIEITFTDDDYKTTPKTFDNIIDRCIKDSIDKYNAKNQNRSVEYKLCSTDFQGLSMQQQLQAELANDSWWKLRNYKPQAMGLTFTPVFVFDQFEEVFSQPGSVVWTKTFFDWLEDVSTDSCPERIIEKIRSTIGTDAAFPIIKEEKDFKAIFSLRKEYIGELDYWSMQQSFIPAMKDNRYCLKALTYDGAKKVMTQQKLFDADKVEQVLHYFVSQYSREPNRTISKNLPIIPALLLSVVGDTLEKDVSAFVSFRMSEIGQSLNTTLERFYDKAIDSVISKLSEQGFDVQSNQCRKDLDKAIFALIDGNGKRVRTKTTATALTQVDFDAIFKKVLCDQRLIKVSKIDNEDYVELVHDSLCPIVAKKKEQRLLEEAEQEILLEQKRKMRKRKIQMGVILLFALASLGLGAFVYRQNEKLQINLSRVVAEKASQLVDEGDSYLARLLLLELTHGNHVFVPEAESALRKAFQHDGAILRGHSDRVYSANFSPDGKYIVSSSDDGTIRIWDAKTGQTVGKPLEGYSGSDNFANFSPDGKYIVSSPVPGTIRIWDTKTRQAVMELNPDRHKPLRFVIFSPDSKYIVSASVFDNSIRIWDAKTGKVVGKPLEGHIDRVYSASFSPDGKYIVSSSSDKTIRIWDAKTSKAVGKPLEGHTGSVRSASFSPDGKYIVSASSDKTIRIWDAKTSKAVGKPLEGHTGIVRSASFSPDGKYIVSASDDGTIRIWEAKTGQAVGKPLEGHIDRVYSASFSPDGKYIVSSSSDKTIRIWDAKIGQAEGKPLEGHTGSAVFANFSPDGKYIVSTEEKDRIIRIWDAKTGKAVGKPLDGHSGGVMSDNFSPDGKYIVSTSQDGPIWLNFSLSKPSDGHFYIFSANFCLDRKYIVSASMDGTIYIWDAKKNKAVGKPLDGHTDTVFSANFNLDGKYIISTPNDSTICILDIKTGQVVGKPLEGHTSTVNSASFSPDGKYIVSASNDKTIRIWDAKTGKTVGKPLEGHTNIVYFAHFSPDGKYIVSASSDKTIRIWDAKTSKAVGKPLEGHTGIVRSASFSPDGKYIVSASDDGTIRIWEAKTGQAVGKPLEGHIDRVYSASFSPDGKYIVSSSSDKTIRIWDAKTGHAMGYPLEVQTGGVFSSYFSPDGKSIVSASEDGIQIWNFPSLQDLLNQTRERFKNRQLTKEERQKYYLE